MGTEEQDKPDNAQTAPAQAAQKREPWWFQQPNPIDRFTGWLVAFTALLFVATIFNAVILWITDHTLKTTLEANNRAWVAPTSVAPPPTLVVNQGIEGTLFYRNMGQSPALRFSFAMEMKPAYPANGVIPLGEDICASVPAGEGAFFPNPTPTATSFPLDRPNKVIFDLDMLSQRRFAVWKGCFRYTTYGRERTTAFCYYLRKTGQDWFWQDCGVKAD